jgi:hypothetical protein
VPRISGAKTSLLHRLSRLTKDNFTGMKPEQEADQPEQDEEGLYARDFVN